MDKAAFTKPFGKLLERDTYAAFIPKKIPPRITYDEPLTALISEASLQLGKLSGIGKIIPDPHLLIRPYLRREAVLSSKIEGTQASILDVLRFEAGGMIDEEEKETKRVIEVVNYVDALNESLNDVKSGKKIDLEMITKAHRILMRGVRGQTFDPGELRTRQNWIAVEGTPIQDATYVPPPVEHIHELLSGLVEFIQNPPGRIPVLVQGAMIHYLFEAVHPFGDGNGRIGRLLIPVLLAERGLLDQPLLYLSAYFERHKTEYYSLLLGVSQKSEWIRWVRFFLHGIIFQSSAAAANIQKLMSLKEQYAEKLNIKKSSRTISMIVDYLFHSPIITISGIATYLEITYHPAKNAVESLQEMGILVEHERRQRGKTYMAHEILKILTYET